MQALTDIEVLLCYQDRSGKTACLPQTRGQLTFASHLPDRRIQFEKVELSQETDVTPLVEYKMMYRLNQDMPKISKCTC